MQSVAEIRTLLEVRLKIRGRSLDHQLRKAGRQLPARIRRDARSVAQAATLLGNPKLSRMINVTEVTQAARNVIAYLEAIDPRDRAKGRILAILGKISAVLIAGFILTVWILVERGIV